MYLIYGYKSETLRFRFETYLIMTIINYNGAVLLWDQGSRIVS